ncbi:DUF4329 domain-containing protein [Limnobaculum xujianqingii]|uniref:DUF4329 domain-containing protein n=1 Tax=Limnobaculum xujianqingii TaxID=2738837 RepID=UPI00112887D7|nr:DUF4329 domain-containing protein [Limnobaculum xujianqingii]
MNSYQYASNILKWIDPLGLQKTPYTGSSQDEVAAKVLAPANDKSIRKNKEYGGLIYEKNGQYYATIPVAGTKDRFRPADALLQISNGATIVGDYHTHGDYSTLDGKRTDKDHDEFDSDEFSKKDKSISDQAASGCEKHRSYLGTPSGKFKVYVPGVGTKTL